MHTHKPLVQLGTKVRFEYIYNGGFNKYNDSVIWGYGTSMETRHSLESNPVPIGL